MSEFSEKFEHILDKINLLVERYISIKEKNETLLLENTGIKKQFKEQAEKLKQLESELKTLKVAKSISGLEGNSEEVKKRINEFIREIDKSIGMLNN